MPKPTSQLATEIPATLYTALLEHSDESGRRVSRIVEDALRLYLIRRLGDDYGPGRLDNLYRREIGDI